MIIYRIAVFHRAPKYFFSKEDAERQIDEWQKEGYIFFGTIEEIFVHGNNPFLNNQELID
jgi:hypothetical protein